MELTYNDYFKFKGSDKVYKVLSSNWALTEINKSKIWDVGYVVCKGVKVIHTIGEYDQKNSIDPYKPKKSESKDFELPPERFDLNDFTKITLQILNANPKLQGMTCMGWEPYDNKTLDPNYYSGNYIYPDGNEYTICKKREYIYVYPERGDHCLVMGKNKLPLVSFRINLDQWVDRAYNKLNTKIKELK